MPALLTGLDWVLLALFSAASFATRCYKLEEPKVVLFDEVHFGKFVNSHITGHFYFDIHPPLVKLAMAAVLVATTDYKVRCTLVPDLMPPRCDGSSTPRPCVLCPAG